jgi:hypothetical protein
MASQFSAAPQSLGYIYQVRFALLALLQAEEDTGISIETRDDVTFEKGGTPFELIQLKHRGTAANLTNRSIDLWKTIRVWSTYIKQGNITPSSTRLILVSTAQAQPGSIAYLLGADNRNENLAYQMLLAEANSPQNASLKDPTLPYCFNSFLNLSDNEQLSLTQATYILDGSPKIDDIPDRIKNMLLAVHRKHRNDFYERLEGWWFGKVITHLGNQDIPSVLTRFEVEDKIADLAYSFGPEALPTDFYTGEPIIPQDADQRIFVKQLQEIGVHPTRVQKAIQDYYRAYEQRSRWARADLLIGEELTEYEDHLVDEWERFAAAVIEALPINPSEDELSHCGRDIFNKMEFHSIRIREKVTAEYVMRGTYHILADLMNGRMPRVWWHPQFIERLQTLLQMPSL